MVKEKKLEKVLYVLHTIVLKFFPSTKGSNVIEMLKIAVCTGGEVEAGLL